MNLNELADMVEELALAVERLKSRVDALEAPKE